MDYNLIVIGAGSAGLVTSYIGATLNAKVALIEKHKMGGDCLNTGCVPSKALITTARFLAEVKRHPELGVKHATADIDFAEVMERVQAKIRKIEPHDSVERYTQLGVDCLQGAATVKSPHEVEVNGKTLTTRNLVIATGSQPFLPPIPGLDALQPLTSDTLWELRELPGRFVVLGGGPIGSEMAQTFQRLGSQVIQVESQDRILSKEDPDVAEYVQDRFVAEGVDLRLNTKAVAARVDDGQKVVVVEDTEGNRSDIPCDQVLVAVGRRANTSGFGLEDIGVRLTDRGLVDIDAYGRSSVPNIYACGDCASPWQFTHMAAHGAYYASVNALFDPVFRVLPFLRQKIATHAIPWCTYTEPEVAHVGLNEQMAKQQGVAYEVATYGIDDLDRAIAESVDYGMVKVLTKPGKDHILGATIVASDAGNMLSEFALARNHGIGLNKIMGTIHPYPTLAEANKFVASAWKNAHKPEGLLNWLGKFHNWRRG